MKKWIAIYMLCVLSLMITPKEYIHALHPHTETKHVLNQHYDNTLETEHDHCPTLKFELPLYLGTCSFAFSTIIQTIDIQYTESDYELIWVRHIYASLRAPPQILA